MKYFNYLTLNPSPIREGLKFSGTQLPSPFGEGLGVRFVFLKVFSLNP
jgi:hypothetical protein